MKSLSIFWICFLGVFLKPSLQQEENKNSENNEEVITPEIEYGNPDDLLNVTTHESDKLLTCVEILSLILRRDAKIIEDVGNMLAGRVTQEQVSQKITGDMLNQCYYSIDDASVSSVFFNGEFMEPDFSAGLLEFADIDYSKYKLLGPSEFGISPETQILFMKIEKARNDYMANAKQRMEKGKGEFRIFGYSLTEVPKSVNLIVAIVIFSLFAGGILYGLKTLNSSQNSKRAAGRKLEKNQKNK